MIAASSSSVETHGGMSEAGVPEGVRLLRRCREPVETVKLLADSLSPGAVADWFEDRNRYLDGRRPVDLLIANQHDPALEAARAFIESSRL